MLFDSYQLGRLSLRNRVVMAPMRPGQRRGDRGESRSVSKA